jgi:hypothetical protein
VSARGYSLAGWFVGAMLLRGYSESSLKAGVGSRAPWMHGGFSAASDTAPLAFTKMHFSAALSLAAFH